MANRHWVGGNAAWNNTAGQKWSLTEGGAGGQAVPTSSDDVFFNAGSGNVIVTFEWLAATLKCASLNFTGFTGTLNGNNNGPSVTISGSLTFGSAMSFGGYANAIRYLLAGTGNVTSNGKSITCYSLNHRNSSAYTYQDNLVMDTGIFTIPGTAVTIDLNDKNITTPRFYVDGTATGTLNLGNGTINAAEWYVNPAAGITINAEGSTIQLTSLTDFNGAGKTYNVVKLYDAASSTGTKIIGNNTFAVLQQNRTAGNVKIVLNASSNQTIGSFLSPASGTNMLTLTSSTSNNATLTKSGGGVNYMSRVNCAEITGSAPNVWYMGKLADGSVDGGGNSNIIFGKIALTDPTNVYADDGSYATAINSNGIIYIELSGDDGVSYTAPLSKTYTGSDSAQTYGAGKNELWGDSWTGAQFTDANFKLRVYGDWFEQVFTTFGFTASAGSVISGIEVVCKAKWDGTTISIDNIKVKLHSLDFPAQAGSIAYASDGRKNGEGAGSGTGVLVFSDGTDWIAVDTGAVVSA